MIGECWAIVALIFMLFVAFLRQGKREACLFILPLPVVPLAHIASGALAGFLSSLVPLPVYFLRACLDIVGLVAACMAFGILSLPLKKGTRAFYLAACGGFSLILCLVLLYDTLGPYL